MYHVRVITGENVVVEHHMLYEPLDSASERKLLDGKEGHWVDVERIPFDHRTDYVLETENDFADSECSECAEDVAAGCE